MLINTLRQIVLYFILFNTHLNKVKVGEKCHHLTSKQTEAQKDEVICPSSEWQSQELNPGLTPSSMLFAMLNCTVLLISKCFYLRF